MYRQSNAYFLLIAVLSFPVFAQQPSSRAEVAKVVPPSNATGSSNAGAEVLAFERALEAAVVRGDVAYVDSISAPDLTFTHGDGWTTGGKPLLVDDRKAFLKRVEDRYTMCAISIP